MEVHERNKANGTRSRTGQPRPGEARARTGRASPLRGESSALGSAWRPGTGVDRRTKALVAALLLALLGLAFAIWWNVSQFQAGAPAGDASSSTAGSQPERDSTTR